MSQAVRTVAQGVEPAAQGAHPAVLLRGRRRLRGARPQRRPGGLGADDRGVGTRQWRRLRLAHLGGADDGFASVEDWRLEASSPWTEQAAPIDLSGGRRSLYLDHWFTGSGQWRVAPGRMRVSSARCAAAAHACRECCQGIRREGRHEGPFTTATHEVSPRTAPRTASGSHGGCAGLHRDYGLLMHVAARHVLHFQDSLEAANSAAIRCTPSSDGGCLWWYLVPPCCDERSARVCSNCRPLRP